ncbi:hypothetical protein [Chamaesiphon sp.]|uniref:hypothetical protein n=1 Tax=Chamaesiphon sp. TaxID=2814140 RepID=UPI0035935E70
MNKLIQTIALTAVVFSPLSLISLISSATAHHTSSHVSTVATEISQTTKKKSTKSQMSGKKKPMSGMGNKKPATGAASDSGMTSPSGSDTPTTPPRSTTTP